MNISDKISYTLAFCDIDDQIRDISLYTILVPFRYEDNFDENTKYIEEDDDTTQKFESQFEYLGKIYYLLLQDLVRDLNHYHNKKFDLRQWELIIGPWLRVYLESTYYRWPRLDDLFKNDIKQLLLTDENRLNETPRQK